MPTFPDQISAPTAGIADVNVIVDVLVALPKHSALAAAPLQYLHHTQPPPGTLVRVPLGKRQVLGIVWERIANAEPSAPDPSVLKPIIEVFVELPAFTASWRELIAFTARYYQRSLGEVALAALPPQLRELNAVQLSRRMARSNASDTPSTPRPAPPVLTDQQRLAVNTICSPIDTGQAPILLFGSTGSGKTEVYLRAVAQTLEQDPQAQALVMVPEINLTPQLEQQFSSRFPQHHIAVLHSGTTPAQRLKGWLAAHTGKARVILGTRMAVLTSIPQLRLIIVDEEHDPSYKQQEGARYWARDLAVYRGHHGNARVVLGSATPSLESWHHSRPVDDGGGRYVRIEMPQRIGNASPAVVRLIDMSKQAQATLFSPALLQAITEHASRKEQSLLLLNRRGYAPVLHCKACSWKSQCPHCSAYRVYHKADRSLRCHHCAYTEAVPRSCPNCGNQDVRTLGSGTEHIEEALTQQLQQVRLPDGQTLKILRIDSDTSRHAGSLGKQLAQVHRGEVDVLVGTQMIAKGHDFRRVTLVAALNPDSALFSNDFRAPERLFSLLMQAGGRAGRDASINTQSELWIQTHFPQHALFSALQQHDYPAFAQQQLNERRSAAMPPFSHQALIQVESRDQQSAQDFLNASSRVAQLLPEASLVSCYPAVPMTPQRIANRERAQMLIESNNRAALQRFLRLFNTVLQQQDKRSILRWLVDVDPLTI